MRIAINSLEIELRPCGGLLWMKCGAWSCWMKMSADSSGSSAPPARWAEVRHSGRGDISVYLGRLEITWGRDGGAAVVLQSA
jgi:hypothetical protein